METTCKISVKLIPSQTVTEEMNNFKTWKDILLVITEWEMDISCSDQFQYEYLLKNQFKLIKFQK